jgi:hypothetical protein
MSGYVTAYVNEMSRGQIYHRCHPSSGTANRMNDILRHVVKVFGIRERWAPIDDEL